MGYHRTHVDDGRGDGDGGIFGGNGGSGNGDAGAYGDSGGGRVATGVETAVEVAVVAVVVWRAGRGGGTT